MSEGHIAKNKMNVIILQYLRKNIHEKREFFHNEHTFSTKQKKQCANNKLRMLKELKNKTRINIT